MFDIDGHTLGSFWDSVSFGESVVELVLCGFGVVSYWFCWAFIGSMKFRACFGCFFENLDL